MSEELDRQAVTYRLDAVYLGTGHYKAAERLQRRARRLGVPSTALSAVIGTAIFASLTKDPALGWRIVTGLAAVLAAVLAALHTFLGYSGLSETHRNAGHSYASLRRRLDGVLLDLRDGGSISADHVIASLDDARRRLDELGRASPIIPDSDYDRGRREIEREAAMEPTSKGLAYRDAIRAAREVD
jgi:hypothetical protein